MDELIYDSLIFDISTGDIITKEKKWIWQHSKLKPNLMNVDCEERKIEAFGDTAIVSTILYMKGSHGKMKLDKSLASLIHQIIIPSLTLIP